MIDIPRWVHRDQSSQLVESWAGLREAEAEGWRVNPNEPETCYASDAPPEPSPEPEDAPEPVEEVPAEAPEDAGEPEPTPEGDEAADPPKRKPGRPKKGG